MKNILGKEQNLTLFNEQGKAVYSFESGSNGYSWKRTYNEKGNRLTYQMSDGYSWEKTYDSNGKQLTYKNSDGYSSERTYDEKGKELTFKDSKGKTRGFDIPEFTMAELVEKLGIFKLKL